MATQALPSQAIPQPSDITDLLRALQGMTRVQRARALIAALVISGLYDMADAALAEWIRETRSGP